MNRTISSREASQQFDELLDNLAGQNDVAIVERNGNPVAVVISIESYQRLVESQADRDWHIIDRLRDRNRNVDLNQAERDVQDALAEVRRARRQSA